jgi:hypothetical protein
MEVMDKGGEMIRLTEHEWNIVDMQCRSCRFWTVEGCVEPSAAYPEPVEDCSSYDVDAEEE